MVHYHKRKIKRQSRSEEVLKCAIKVVINEKRSVTRSVANKYNLSYTTPYDTIKKHRNYDKYKIKLQLL